jgi:putative phosphoribosyl transferase
MTRRDHGLRIARLEDMQAYLDRRHAGKALALHLAKYAGRSDVTVLALPRGGVPVGFEVAQALRVPLDVFVVRKLGFPGHPEYAMGAIATGNIRVMNEDALSRMHIPQDVIEEITRHEQQELARRERAYREGSAPLPIRGRIVILVDDGLATGSTVRAAVAALRQLAPAWIVVAVPISSPHTCAELGEEVDEIVCAVTPEPFHAVGQWYRDFSATSDDEVRELLHLARARELTQTESPSGHV